MHVQRNWSREVATERTVVQMRAQRVESLIFSDVSEHQTRTYFLLVRHSLEQPSRPFGLLRKQLRTATHFDRIAVVRGCAQAASGDKSISKPKGLQ